MPAIPEKPEGWEISDNDWVNYVRDMENMRREYERCIWEDEPCLIV